MTDDAPPAPSSSRILLATAVAAAIALVVLVAAVLPAEYGIDPLGTGRALGLTALSGTTADADVAPAAVPAGAAAPATFNTDEYQVELRPFEGVEYKYRLEQGASLVYSWEATGAVGFEFHGEPDGAPPKYFDSYLKGEGDRGQGGFIAEKAGIHGWFWENPGATRITVTLRSAGFYAKSTEYRDGDHIDRTFPKR